MPVVANLLKRFFSDKADIERLSKVVIPSFIIHAFAGVLAFALIFVLTRTLGAQQYGVYTYSFAIAGILINLSTFGINVMAVRETSALLSKGKVELWKGFCRWSVKTLVITCLLIAIMAAIGIAVLTYYFHLLKETPFSIPVLCVLAVIPFFGLMNYYSSLLRGKHNTVISLLPDNIVKPFVFLVLLVFAIILFGKLNALRAIILSSVSIVVALVFAFVAFTRTNQHKAELPQYELSRWKNSLRSFMFLAIITSIGSKVDIVTLGFLKDASSVGIYGSANTVATFLVVFLSVMNQISAATISRLNALEERENLQATVTKIIRGVFVCSIPFYILIIVFSKWIMLYFGADFIKGQYALIILATGQLVSILFGPVGMVAMMTGNEKFNAIFICVGIIISVLLNFILVPFLGVNGTAIATAAGLVTWNCGMYISMKRKTGLRTWIFG